MFQIKAGTKVRAYKNDNEITVAPTHITKNDCIFDKHEVEVDPVGKLGCHRGFAQTIGGKLAACGYYVFKSEENGWHMIVHASFVQYLG